MFVTILASIFFWIGHHRKTKVENMKRVSTFDRGSDGFVVKGVRKAGLPLDLTLPHIAEKDSNPVRDTAQTASPAYEALPPSRGTSSVVSPLSSPSPSPRPQDNAHTSIAVSPIGSKDNDRLSTQVSASSLRVPIYKSFSSAYIHQLPALSNPSLTHQAASDKGSRLGQSWLADDRSSMLPSSKASELPGTAIGDNNRNTFVSQLMGSLPETRK